MKQLNISQSFTPRGDIALDKYLADISKRSTITAEEETELAQRYQQGDTDALEQLVNANLRFVVSVAKQYQHHGVDLIDLISEGNIGLMKAAKRYDPSKGFKFISYAVWWIRQAIINSLGQHSRTVRVPANQTSNNRKIREAKSLFEQKMEREPTANEMEEIIADEELMSGIDDTSTVSLNTAVPGTDNFILEDTLAAESAPVTDNLYKESLKKDMARLVSKLRAQEQRVLNALFGLEDGQVWNVDELAEVMGYSRERIRQIKESALRKLRSASNSRVVSEYL